MRYCTGTPPRIDGRTIHFTFLEKQFGDSQPIPFSYLNLQSDFKVHVLLVYCYFDFCKYIVICSKCMCRYNTAA